MRTKGNGCAIASTAAEIQGKGSALATKAVGAQGNGTALAPKTVIFTVNRGPAPNVDEDTFESSGEALNSSQNARRGDEH